jgi:hypothetical protein
MSSTAIMADDVIDLLIERETVSQATNPQASCSDCRCDPLLCVRGTR